MGQKYVGGHCNLHQQVWNIFIYNMGVVVQTTGVCYCEIVQHSDQRSSQQANISSGGHITCLVDP